MSLKKKFYARYCCLWKSNTICENQIVPIAYKQEHVSKRFQVLTPVIRLQLKLTITRMTP